MNISINFSPDTPLQQFGYRPTATPKHQQTNQSGSAAMSSDTAKIDTSKPNNVHVLDTQPDQIAESKMELQANNPDYRIKMLIERPAGTTTLKTELNFYKKNVNQEYLSDKHDVDLLA